MKKFACFHIGRGGNSYNQGFKTYRNDIKNFQELLKYYADKLFEYTEDENGNKLPDEEWAVKDETGRILLQGRNEIESETGCLNFDGDYDTTYICGIDELDKEEAEAIIRAYESGDYVDDEILDAACDVTGAVHVHTVEVDGDELKIATNKKATFCTCCVEYRSDWQDCTTKEFYDHLKEEDVLKRDIEKVMSVAENEEWFD